MSIPSADLAVPEVVAEIARGRELQPVWLNDLGGRTFRIAGADGDEYVKWCPPHPEFDLGLEAAKLAWAGAWITVPEVLGVGHEVTGHSWLHTRALPGESAVTPRWVAEPESAARAIGAGLRTLHDRLPVAECEWGWTIADRLAERSGPEVAALAAQAPAEDLVVCHGDACAPNTLLTPDGVPSGHVDLGRLGLADRWADLAVATYSLAWNYSGNWESALLDAYGIERDAERIAYYRRLWDAT